MKSGDCTRTCSHFSLVLIEAYQGHHYGNLILYSQFMGEVHVVTMTLSTHHSQDPKRKLMKECRVEVRLVACMHSHTLVLMLTKCIV